MFEYMESKITDLLALLSERDEKLIKIEKIVEQIDYNFNEFFFKVKLIKFIQKVSEKHFFNF